MHVRVKLSRCLLDLQHLNAADLLWTLALLPLLLRLFNQPPDVVPGKINAEVRFSIMYFRVVCGLLCVTGRCLVSWSTVRTSFVLFIETEICIRRGFAPTRNWLWLVILVIYNWYWFILMYDCMMIISLSSVVKRGIWTWKIHPDQQPVPHWPLPWESHPWSSR